MDELKKVIKEKRPNISQSSVNTYYSILSNLYKKVFGKLSFDINKFEDTDKILSFLKDIPSPKRKTILSALVIITNDKKYRDLMLEDIQEYNKESLNQEMNDKQKENWITSDEISNIYKEYKTTCESLYKKSKLTNTDYQNIQSFMILSLLGGIFIPPRRSKDCCDFKIKNIDPKTDNQFKDLLKTKMNPNEIDEYIMLLEKAGEI